MGPQRRGRPSDQDRLRLTAASQVLRPNDIRRRNRPFVVLQGDRPLHPHQLPMATDGFLALRPRWAHGLRQRSVDHRRRTRLPAQHQAVMLDVEGGDRIAAPGQCHGTPLLLSSAYSPTRANWCLVTTRCTTCSTGLTRLGRAEQTPRENARACNLSLDHRQCQAAPANQHLDHAMAAPFGRLRFLGGQPLLRHAELDGLHGAGQMPCEPAAHPLSLRVREFRVPTSRAAIPSVAVQISERRASPISPSTQRLVRRPRASSGIESKAFCASSSKAESCCQRARHIGWNCACAPPRVWEAGATVHRGWKSVGAQGPPGDYAGSC